MANKITIKIVGDAQRYRAKLLVDQAPIGYIVSISEEGRSAAQNRLLWPLIRDVRGQVEGHAEFSPDDTKIRFMQAYGKELRFLPELDGSGYFPVGQSSKELSKSQFSGLIEYIYQYGATHDVIWSDRSHEAMFEAGVPKR